MVTKLTRATVAMGQQWVTRRWEDDGDYYGVNDVCCWGGGRQAGWRKHGEGVGG